MSGKKQQVPLSNLRLQIKRDEHWVTLKTKTMPCLKCGVDFNGLCGGCWFTYRCIECEKYPCKCRLPADWNEPPLKALKTEEPATKAEEPATKAEEPATKAEEPAAKTEDATANGM